MKTKYWILILAAVLLLSAAGSIVLFLPGKASTQAEISSDGTLFRVVDLQADQEFTISCPGGYNTVTIQDGRIAVTEASCPDQYCVRQGFCNGGRSIVCLPNKLVITFVGDQEIDGQIG